MKSRRIKFNNKSLLQFAVLLLVLSAGAVGVTGQQPSPSPRRPQAATNTETTITGSGECPAAVAAAQQSSTTSSFAENTPQRAVVKDDDVDEGTPQKYEQRAPHDLRGGYLRRLKYNVGLGEEHTLVYMDLASNYSTTTTTNGPPPDGRRLCKFYNLSPRKLHLIRKDDTTGRFELMDAVEAVSTAGVTCTVGDHYLWLDRSAPQKPAHEIWIPDTEERHFAYQEDYDSLETNKQRECYLRFLRGIRFDEMYRRKTGRSYLGSPYPPRPPPQHFMWPADYIGQEHFVEFDGVERSLLVLSASPRILIMDNFLSEKERHEIQALAEAQGFSNSTTLSANDSKFRRTSQTSWLQRTKHAVVRNVYQRAGQLLKMPNMSSCCAEDLQVVHYDSVQEYRAHYDFKLPAVWAQPVRFATLLIYLQDTVEGGDTIFPLAAGGPLAVKPQAGTAILFYSLLPDGNVDEHSLHASTPVEKGTKRVCNMWIWDPFRDETTLD